MKAVRMHTYGGPDALAYEEAPRPRPGPDEVRVRVAAAGVNAVDGKVRAGCLLPTFPLPLPWIPWIPGVDFAGTVEAKGPDVWTLAVGEEVFGKTDLPAAGTYAEHVVVPAAYVLPRPRTLNTLRAAALPLAALTAWQSLFGQGSLQIARGQRLLVLGAAGGVGGFAVQLARWKGARVIALARPRHEPYLRDLGAEEVVDGATLPQAGPVDAVLDLVGGELADRAWRQLRQGGAFVSTVASPDGGEESGHAARAGMVLTRMDTGQLREIATLVERGVLRIEVAGTFPLNRAADAHRQLQSGGAAGKLVLTVS